LDRCEDFKPTPFALFPEQKCLYNRFVFMVKAARGDSLMDKGLLVRSEINVHGPRLGADGILCQGRQVLTARAGNRFLY
jgi:hypothetical protein